MNAKVVVLLAWAGLLGSCGGPAAPSPPVAPVPPIAELDGERLEVHDDEGPDLRWRWYGDGNAFLFVTADELTAVAYEQGVSRVGDRVLAFRVGSTPDSLIEGVSQPVALRIAADNACTRGLPIAIALERREIAYSLSTHDELPPEAWECVRQMRPRAIYVGHEGTRALALAHAGWRQVLVGFGTRGLTRHDAEALRECSALRAVALNRPVSGAMAALRGAPITALDIEGGDDEAFAAIAGLPTLRTLSLRFPRSRGLPPLGELTELRELDLARLPLDDAGAEQLAELRRLRRLRVSDTALTHLDSLAGLEALEYLDAAGAPIRSLAGLTRLRAMRVLRLSRAPIDGDELAALASLERLEVLRLDGTGIDGASLAHLARLRAMRRLDLSRTGVDGAGLEHLRDLTELRSLDLHETSVDDAGLAHLRGLEHLSHLNLFGTEHVTGAGLAHLAELRALRSLDVGAMRLDAEGLRTLLSSSALDQQLLYLGYVRFRGESPLAPLRERTELRELSLFGTNVSDADVAPIAGLHALTFLDLGRTEIGDEGVRHVRGLRALRRLRLSFTNVTDAGLAAVAELHELRTLELIETPVGDVGVTHLAGLTNLETLLLNGTRITDRGVRGLRRLPRLRVLGLRYTSQVTDAAIDDLLALPAIEEVNVGGGVQYGDDEPLEAAMSEEGQRRFRRALAERLAARSAR